MRSIGVPNLLDRLTLGGIIMIFLLFFSVSWQEIKEKHGNLSIVSKLRLLRDKIRRWNKDVFGNINCNLDLARTNLEVFERSIQDKIPTDSDFH